MCCTAVIDKGAWCFRDRRRSQILFVLDKTDVGVPECIFWTEMASVREQTIRDVFQILGFGRVWLLRSR